MASIVLIPSQQNEDADVAKTLSQSVLFAKDLEEELLYMTKNWRLYGNSIQQRTTRLTKNH